MQDMDRRSALTLGLAAASMAAVRPAIAQPADALGGKDELPGPGIVVRSFGGAVFLAPSGFATVSLRDVIMQPGAKLPENAEMMNAMICHITEGELQIVQDGKAFTAKQNYAWTCNKGTKEVRPPTAAALWPVMPILDLKA